VGDLPRIAWDSVLDDATISTSGTTEDDGEAANAADWLPWTFFRPTGSAPYSLEAVLDGTQSVSAWAMAGHDGTGAIAMDYWNGAAWVEHSTATGVGDSAVLYVTGATVSTTKLRFRFADLSYLAVLWAGVDMELPEGLRPGWTDPLLAQRAEINPEVSRDGVWLGASIERWDANLTLDLNNLDVEWVRDEWMPFLRVCSIRPFFLHWNAADWADSACLCTQAKFGGSPFSSVGFIDVSVSFMADTGYDRRNAP
jgi:hypothetical protein